jgi:hypothetical protein
MTSPQAPAICPKEGVDLVPDHLCTLGLGLALAQAAGATATIMLIKTTAILVVQHPSKGIHPSMGTCTPPRVTTADAFIAWTKAILCLPPFLLQSKEEAHPEIGNCASREN